MYLFFSLVLNRSMYIVAIHLGVIDGTANTYELLLFAV